MKVLHILDHSLPLHSGYSFRSAAIFRHQRQMNWDTLHMTTPRFNTVVADSEEVASGLNFYRTSHGWLGKVLPGKLSMIAEILATARRGIRLARDEDVDVLHAHSPVLTGIAALLIRTVTRKPVVYEIRAFWEDAAVDLGHTKGWSFRYRLTRATETLLCKLSDHVTTICEGLRGDLILRGIPDSRITVIPNAVNTDELRPAEIEDSELRRSLNLVGNRVIGFYGSFYAYEGLDLLLEAIGKLSETRGDIRLLLVGGGPQSERLKGLAEQLGVQDSVVFVGRVPNDEIARYYGLADVVAFPRKSMRLTELVTPLKPLEAMAQGIPVVASNVGGHAELIVDGKTGLLFPADSSDHLAKAIEKMLDESLLADAIRKEALAFVKSERTWAKSVNRYASAYRRVGCDI